jgi:hypothetical protein
MARRRRRNDGTSFNKYIGRQPGLIAYWPLQELYNAVAVEHGSANSIKYPGLELLANPGLPFTFTADDPDDWTIRGDDANQAVGEVAVGEFHTDAPTVGGGYMNIWRSGGASVAFLSDIGAITTGQRYRAIVDLDVSSGSLTFNRLTPNVTISASGVYVFEGIASANQFDCVTATDPTDITFKSIKVSDANPMNGDHTSVTLGQPGNWQLGRMASYDGSTSTTDIYSAELNTAFDTDTGTLLLIAKSDTWAAGIDVLVRLAADDNNEVIFTRSGSDLILEYNAGGTSESVTVASGSPTKLFMAALTWDTTGGGEVKAFYNGLQSGTTQTIAGSWAGALASTLCRIGSINNAPDNVFAGDIAHVMLFDRVLSASEIRENARRGGVI